MIPLRLHLTNFLSYGDSCDPIDLDGIHLACLCGPNGHGKSALLDAITWVLWGQARSPSADDLMRLGQTSMQVELEFLLEDQRYRVIRRRTRGRSSLSDLQFQLRSEGDAGTWRAITGQGVRGTQELINRTLRMDYETFINSAFLLQGRADEFARKTPGDRKRILGEILNLGVYDQLSELARGRRSEAQQRAGALEAQIVQMEVDHARLPELQAQAERLAAAQLEARLTVEKGRAEQQQALVEKARLDAIRKERDDLARRLQRAETELGALRQQLLAAQKKADAHRALLSRAGEVRSRAQALLSATRERDEQTARLSELRGLEQQQTLLERQIQQERSALETRLQLAQHRARQLRVLAEQIPRTARDAEALAQEVETLDRLQDERGTLLAKLPELAAEGAALAAEERRAAEDLAKAEERFQLLKSAQAKCPLCEGELPEEKRRLLGRQLRDERAALRQARELALQRQVDTRKAEGDVRGALEKLDRRLKTGQAVRDRLAQTRERHRSLSEAVSDLPQRESEAGELAALLREGPVAAEAQRALGELQKRIAAVGFNRERHEACSRKVQQLAAADRELHALEQAEQQLPEEELHVTTLAEGARRQEEALAEDRAARTAADRALEKLVGVEARAEALTARLHQAEQAEAAAGQRLGAAREACQRCAELSGQIAARRRDRELAARDQAGYEELTRAFGRNGIQALIIENALPEIESEANALLSRMSDGQLAVRLKTQRELRSGAAAETLEIEISDGMGGRKYELYSGGEAFRVNFAIRIALSKLLARRAGAHLETLVIDEGFGSQDQEGRQRMVEAIQSIQDDFARILVITHIDELKDLFPTRIEVTKGPGGSQVAIY